MADSVRPAVLHNRESAFALVRRAKGKTFFVRGGAFLVTEVVDGENKRGFDMMCFIAVSRKAATKYIEDIYSEGFERRGARINIAESDSCLFIG